MEQVNVNFETMSVCFVSLRYYRTQQNSGKLVYVNFAAKIIHKQLDKWKLLAAWGCEIRNMFWQAV